MVFRAIEDAAGQVFARCAHEFKHCLSSEKDPNKVKFIEKMHAPARLYTDCNLLASKTAHCEITKRDTEIASPHLWVGGFPCQDVSAQNAKRAQNRVTCADGDKRTGAGFQMWATYVNAALLWEEVLSFGTCFRRAYHLLPRRKL
jgi:site-specific DNA-cytosine methylase